MTTGQTRTAARHTPSLGPAWVLERLVRLYQLTLASLVPGACRFEPSCSAYARDAFCTHGAIRGTWLTLRRLVRCQPWCDGGFDPVPPAACGHRHAD